MSMKNEVKKFRIHDKLGYMFGDFGNDFTFILSSSYLACGKVPPLDQAHVRTGCDRFFPDLSERACGDAHVWFWYPLHKADVDKNVEILKQKHGR